MHVQIKEVEEGLATKEEEAEALNKKKVEMNQIMRKYLNRNLIV